MEVKAETMKEAEVKAEEEEEAESQQRDAVGSGVREKGEGVILYVKRGEFIIKRGGFII